MKIVQSDGNYLPRCNYDDIAPIQLSMMNWMLWSNSIIVSNDFHIDMNKFVTKKGKPMPSYKDINIFYSA